MGNLMKDFIKKITGIKKLEEERERAKKETSEALVRAAEALAKEEEARRQEELAKMTPKERATANNEPWVAVLDTKVNPDNIRNGFFELDWNDLFVLKLKQEGYGEDGDKDEEIIDRWFRELCANVVVDGDFGGPVNTGVIDIKTVKKDNL